MGYRSTCESTMEELRRNKDSLMAVLEAFVYDPLLNWRLIDKKPKSKKSKAEGLSAGSKGQMSVAAGSGENNMESLVEYREIVSKKNDSMVESVEPEALNKKALDIVQRVRDKLTGKDFNTEDSLEVCEQVELLINQATSHENLCQCYIGWCPFWSFKNLQNIKYLQLMV